MKAGKSGRPVGGADGAHEFVRVRGAREHNLKNVDVDIPRDTLVVFTGVSGSGKSSLAFGTLYAEVQRRYLESVAPYARRLFHQMGIPGVDEIDGIPPAVALQQQRGTPTTRSSLGSVTTLGNLLRMPYSRAGDYPPGQPIVYAGAPPGYTDTVCCATPGVTTILGAWPNAARRRFPRPDAPPPPPMIMPPEGLGLPIGSRATIPGWPGQAVPRHAESLTRRAGRKATLALGLAIVLAAAGCAPATRPAAISARENPDATEAQHDWARRARIIPRVDHHQHIMGPTAARRRPAPPPPVILPAPLDSLLRERGRLSGSADAGDLYTEDAQVVDRAEETFHWVQGREAAAAVVSGYPTGRELVPNAFFMDGAVAHVAGEVLNVQTRRPMATFSMGLRRDAQGRWRIATEMLTQIFEWPFERVITADALVANMNEAGIERAVVLSVAYWFGGPSQSYSEEEYARVRAENDWTAAQVARHPDRLVAFCGISPLRDYAVPELRRCGRELGMKGIKMHFRGAEVDILDNPQHVEKVRQVFQAANDAGMTIVVHSEARGEYGRAHAEAFLNRLLPAAPDVIVQIAHLWGGNQYRAEPLAVYAEAIAAGDPRTRNLYFDLAEAVPGALGSDQALREIAQRIRQIGLDRVLYGSDATTAGGARIAQRWAQLRHRLPLTDAELQDIADNVAPYLR
jgi:predicted TIM-barrel fold metal-dependent hydrolase